MYTLVHTSVCIIYRVSAEKVVKIAHFGMAKYLGDHDCYGMQDLREAVPIKWTALECFDSHSFDANSDVVSLTSALSI